jgi:hypothetical protein
MVGVSMAIAMIVCIAAFIWLYVQIQPLFSDFIPQSESEEPHTAGIARTEPQPTATPTVAGASDDDSDIDDSEDNPTPAQPTPTPEDDDDAESDEWEPTHAIRQGPNVNFRSGPNTISQPQGALAPGTPLLFLDEEEPTGGVVWMRFQIEDATEGWIRDIDIIEIDESG